MQARSPLQELAAGLSLQCCRLPARDSIPAIASADTARLPPMRCSMPAYKVLASYNKPQTCSLGVDSDAWAGEVTIKVKDDM